LIGAEVGVYKGDNAKEILDFLNIERLVLVDPRKGYNRASGTKLGNSPEPVENMGDAFYENLYKEVEDRFADSTNVSIVRESSVNAAKLFDDEFFDFVYIDGDHRYEAVLDDLKAWYPKLKRFGVMCGDDYGHPSGVGVIKAVSEFTFENGLINGYGEDNQFWFVKVA
jgi:hypothetical protein